MKLSWPGWAWFAEGIRTFSPIPLTFTAIALVLIHWKGGWPPETADARIQWLGIALVANIALLGFALFLNRAGITSFSVKGGPVEVSVNDRKDPEE